MNFYRKVKTWDLVLLFFVSVILIISVSVLNSVSPDIFPNYYIYLALGIIFYLLFSRFSFEVVSIFSKHLYFISVFLLLVTLIVGQITRGAVRWIPVGSFSFQPSEIVRPFLFVFLANFVAQKDLSVQHLMRSFLLFFIPFFLILIQPSLSVSVVFLVGFLGIIVSLGINKKVLLASIFLGICMVPLIFNFLAPYQKERIQSFLDPYKNPHGAGYNAIQSMIAVGSGGFLGKGIGQGVQTQLYFLPEKHTDFIFASVSEELGFLGAGVVLVFLFLILFRLTLYMSNSVSPQARAFVSAVFLSLTFQLFVNVSMNLGIFPVSGLPLPLVSTGGSSFISTMIVLGIASTTYRKSGS